VSRLVLRGLLRRPVTIPAPEPSAELLAELAGRLDAAARRQLGRSLSVREVDAGSCNACELEVNALNNAVYDLERFGIRFVASPRHADVLLVTGPVTTNMREALLRTWNCTPAPKWLVAAGDCALGLGPFVGSPALVEGSGAVDMVLPVHLRLRGCPPKPIELLEGLLALLEP
jgi:Ni,Fe-hydrogenase III small subunit